MQRFLSVILIMGAIIAFVGTAEVQGERAVEEWIARYDGDSDYATAMAIDDSANVYVTGMSYGPSSRVRATIKYDSDGNEQWVAWYNKGAGEEVVIDVDGLGNVYVAGTSTSDGYATVKYDANGTELWVAGYDGPSDGPDNPLAIAVADSGKVYVTGRSWSSVTKFDCTTIKYSPDSNEPLWVARYDGPGNDWDVAHAITIDNSGSIYIIGRSKGSGTGPSDYATIKYHPDSNEPLWVARYNGPANDWDQAYAVAVDSFNNIYVTGSSDGIGTYSDYTTIKYGPDSNEPLWVARYNGAANSFDSARAIVVDDSDNIYVTGGSIDAGAGWDFVTIKYSPDSNEPVWVAMYNGPANDDDIAIAIASDDSGNTYVTGYSEGVGTDDDYATIKYDPNGTELWVARYNELGNGPDQPVGIAVDDFGNVYVAGWSVYDSTEYEDDYITIKYTQCIQVGDINCDRDVDFGDFAVLSEHWLESSCGDCGWADMDDDEDVDYNDLKELANNWLEGTS